jgi:hypothetical protein
MNPIKKILNALKIEKKPKPLDYFGPGYSSEPQPSLPGYPAGLQPVVPGNLKLIGRPRVKDGNKTATVRSAGQLDERDGLETVYPTVVNGKLVSPEEGWKHYLKTGEHMGKYANWQIGEEAGISIHNEEQRRLNADLKKKLKSTGK